VTRRVVVVTGFIGILWALGTAGAGVAAEGRERSAGLKLERGAWREHLDAALAGPAFRGAEISALVVDRRTGAEVYSREPDRALVPASNQKLLTGVAALASFGPTHRFITRVLSDTAPDPSGFVDQLYVVGEGDSTLTSEQWWRMAADLRRSGLRGVRSGLILDDSAFDRELWNPAWGEVSSRAYYAPVSALSANYGAFAVAVGPGAKAGAPGVVHLDPPLSHFLLNNQVRTAPAGAPARVQARREAVAEGERITVSGSVGRGRSPRTLYRSSARPTLYAGAVFRDQLAAVGISVAGEVRRGTAPIGAVELLAFEGKSIAQTVRLLMKYSNNQIAEALVKAMGRAASGTPGSWTTGTAALRAALENRGLDLGTTAIVDGSGLARGNRTSARVLVALLLHSDGSFGFGPELLASLPLAGDDGTLEDRAESVTGRMRAKTGRLNGVASLSGMVRTSARDLVFSLLVNGARGGDADVVAGIDAFVDVLAQEPTEARATREKAPITRSAY